MPDDRADHLNAVAREVFTSMGRETLAAGGTDSDLMVILESVIFGGLLFAERAFNVDRRVTVERLELMTERILERLAGEAKRNG